MKQRAEPKSQSFEKLFVELESIVSKLEAGDLSLDESLALFQRGTELSQKCADLLDQAELRVKELAPRGEEVEVEEFEEEEEQE